MAQLADMADQRTNGIVVESVTPGGHARRAAHGQSAQLDGVEQLFVAACLESYLQKAARILIRAAFS
ncbi:MAG: hypothetical protein IIC50_22505 [Planctomycetes bacterium]|nr:hypothetical protein [Planctomycetota bacterium]